MMIRGTTAPLFDAAVIHFLACEAVRHHVEPTEGDSEHAIRFAIMLAGFTFSRDPSIKAQAG